MSPASGSWILFFLVTVDSVQNSYRSGEETFRSWGNAICSLLVLCWIHLHRCFPSKSIAIDDSCSAGDNRMYTYPNLSSLSSCSSYSCTLWLWQSSYLPWCCVCILIFPQVQLALLALLDCSVFISTTGELLPTKLSCSSVFPTGSISL